MNLFWTILYAAAALTFLTKCEEQARSKGYHWSTWSSMPLSCSVTCGRGLRCRIRKCLDGFGNEVTHTRLCHNPEDFASRAESCTTCVVNARCPNLPGWSTWGSWSRCVPNEPGGPNLGDRCKRGVRARYRKCNNPPPAPPPNNVTCSGFSQQTGECSLGCDQRPLRQPTNINQRIGLRVEMDYRKGLQTFRQVLRRREGASIRMSCNTPAYKLAKRLTTEQKFTGKAKGLDNQELHISWYKNGERIEERSQEAGMEKIWREKRNKRELRMPTEKLLIEHRRWDSLLHASVPLIEDTELIFQSVREGDQGLYTCEISLGEERWTTIFYSVVIMGVRYLTQDTDPFYLHSHIGYINALYNGPVWIESAQIVWKLNGIEQSRGLVARKSRRIQLIQNLNRTHEGMWTCYLLVAASGPPSRVNTPWIRTSGVFLLNEFHLKVNPHENSLWQLAENPESLRVLRNVAVTLAMLCEILLLVLLLTIWAARRWTERALTVAQQKAIVNEILDNHCRLMLTARKRAAANRDRLLPLIIQDQKRLERAAIKLTERYVETDDEEEAKSKRKSLWGQASGISKTMNRLSRLFKAGRSSSTEESHDGSKMSVYSKDTQMSELSRKTNKLSKFIPIIQRSSVKKPDLQNTTPTAVRRTSQSPITMGSGSTEFSTGPSHVIGRGSIVRKKEGPNTKPDSTSSTTEKKQKQRKP